jgi:hypothetical protein
MFETLTLICLFAFMTAREVMHYLQVGKLQELLKSVDVTEYYRAKGMAKENARPASPSENLIMEENKLMDDPEFDPTKVYKLNIDGDERDIKIY